MPGLKPGGIKPKAPLGPKGNTKPLFWNTLGDDAVENSVWGQLDADKLGEESIDFDDVEKAFSNQKAAPKPISADAAAATLTARSREKVFC